MNKSYCPFPGSVAYKVIELLKSKPGQELLSTEVAKALGVTSRSLAATLRRAIDVGVISARFNEARRLCLTLSESAPVSRTVLVPAQRSSEPTLRAALFNNGSLFLGGAQAVDGGVQLTPLQTTELREYLLHTGSFIEHLNRLPT